MYVLQAEGREAIRLDAGVTRLSIGSNPDNDIVLNEPSVSTFHANIYLDQDRLAVVDVGSDKGTWVNERQVVGRVNLKDGDQIRFGSLTYKVLDDSDFTQIDSTDGDDFIVLPTEVEEPERVDEPSPEFVRIDPPVQHKSKATPSSPQPAQDSVPRTVAKQAGQRQRKGNDANPEQTAYRSPEPERKNGAGMKIVYAALAVLLLGAVGYGGAHVWFWMQVSNVSENGESAQSASGVEKLLREARDDIDNNRITRPEHNNAYLKYSQVLKQSPGNSAALAGLDDIITSYDPKVGVYRTDPVRASESCRKVRPVILTRWQHSGFASKGEFDSWQSGFTHIDECLELDILNKLQEAGKWQAAEVELVDLESTNRQVLEIDWVGEVWLKDKDKMRNEMKRIVAREFREIAAGKAPQSKSVPASPKSSVTSGAKTNTAPIIVKKPVRKPKLPPTWVDKTTGMEFVLVEGGCFRMGSKSGAHDEQPQRQVCIDDFYMGKHEVTQKQWRAIMNSNPSHFKGDNLPVEQVSWFEVNDYVKKLNRRSGGKYRLPSEAEWEFAASSRGDSSVYSGSDKAKPVSWCDATSSGRTRPVGTKTANRIGLYDMSGNVWEWCADDWSGSYMGAPGDGSARIVSSANKKVVRGGSFESDFSLLRVKGRYKMKGKLKNLATGFRLVKQVKLEG